MQKKLLGLIVIFLCATGVMASSPSALTLIVHFPEDMEPVFTLPLSGSGQIDIDWGDGSLSSVSNPNIDTMANLLMHRYDSPGGYMIHVLGDLNEAHFGVTGSTAIGINALQAVTDWGAIGYVSFEGAFRTAENLQAVPDWLPFGVTDLTNMFSGAISFNGDLRLWDTSNVTNMTRMFADAWVFNSDISAWDTSNVTSMYSMFHHAEAFNQDIGGWDVSSVRDMEDMFGYALAFNQDISGWDMRNVENTRVMFLHAEHFNQDIGTWNTQSVTDMEYMFAGAAAFVQDLSSWCVSQFDAEPEGFATDANPAWTPDLQPQWGEPCG